MKHSAKFEKVKGYYDKGLWSEDRLANAVKKNWITAGEYDEIVNSSIAE